MENIHELSGYRDYSKTLQIGLALSRNFSEHFVGVVMHFRLVVCRTCCYWLIFENLFWFCQRNYQNGTADSQVTVLLSSLIYLAIFGAWNLQQPNAYKWLNEDGFEGFQRNWGNCPFSLLYSVTCKLVKAVLILQLALLKWRPYYFGSKALKDYLHLIECSKIY